MGVSELYGYRVKRSDIPLILFVGSWWIANAMFRMDRFLLDEDEDENEFEKSRAIFRRSSAVVYLKGSSRKQKSFV